MKIFNHNYYGHAIRMMQDDNGEEWINADEFASALEQQLFNKTRH